MKTNQVENERKKKAAIPATVQPVEEDLDMFSDGGDDDFENDGDEDGDSDVKRMVKRIIQAPLVYPPPRQ